MAQPLQLPTPRPVHEWPQAKLDNLRAVYADLAAQRTRLRGRPPVVGLHTSEICNLRCVMCERSVTPGRRKLDRELLQRTLDATFPTAFKAYVTGSNGEPLLGDFDVIEQAALSHGVQLDLATNGTHLTLARYRSMRDCTMRINVSLDAHVPEVYARIRRGGRLERVVDNLRAIAAERRGHPDGVLLDVSAILMRSNAEILPDFVRFAGELGVDHVHIQALRHFAHATPAEEVSDTRAASARRDRAGARPRIETESRVGVVAQHLDRIAAAAEQHRVNVTFGDFLRPPIVHRQVPSRLDGLEPPAGMCWSLALNFSVQHDGTVYPCCHPTDYRLGDLRRQSVDEIWNGKVAARLRAAHYERARVGFCSGCIEAPYLKRDSRTWLRRVGQRARLFVQDRASRWWD
ncbi:MAG: radical SAM protein [bacterium]|nr:radical SAM protein [bacterium]